MARVEKTVFISYRRTDVYTALAVYQELSGKGYDVFFDYTSIPSGDFEQIIISNIKARAHFVLILTPTALDRCSEPNDWLRREIETAIDEKRNIIPLFFKDFKFGMPSVAEKLTGKLASLNRYNGMNVHEDYFHAAMDRLSRQFLDAPLETVLHPVSTEVRKVVKNEQIAADKALRNKKDVQELIKPPAEKMADNVPSVSQNRTPVGVKTAGKGPNLKLYGMIGAGAILFVILAIAGIVGINALINNAKQAEMTATTPTQTVEQPVSTNVMSEPTAASTNTPKPGRPMMLSPKDDMRLVYVRWGEFEMGSDLGEADELPIHTVYLDSYWIDETEVTNAMYANCVTDGACAKPASVYYPDADYADHPVQDVKWDDANDYCSWAGRRLPTEAEWEKAAGWNELTHEKNIYPWGNEFDGSLVNFCDVNCAAFEWADTDSNDGYGATSPVGSYPQGASPYGVMDMAGNVWEWVADFYSDTYYDVSPNEYPTGPASGDDHVIRGGSWASGYNVLTTSYRDRYTALVNFGFRCAMDAEQ